MKKYTYSFLAAALACGMAQAAATAYTTPVGYETITLAPGTYNLTGVRLFNPQVAAGTFESFTAGSLTDDQATFSLDSGTSYIVEFPSGATITALGSDFAGTTLSNLAGIDGTYLGAYVVRKALTIASVFGANDESGLASSPTAEASDADVVYLPDGLGGYDRVFYSTFVDTEAPPENQLDFFGWLDAGTYVKAADRVIDPTQAFFVQTAKSVAPIVMTITGEVKKTTTAFEAKDSYSLVGGVYPAGATLTTSSLKDFILGSPSATASEADIVLLPDGLGGYTRAFYSTYVDTEAPLENQLDFFGWLNAGTYEKIPNEPITPGFFIQKIGPDISGSNTPPAFYSNL
jgi:hypothetical protein